MTTQTRKPTASAAAVETAAPAPAAATSPAPQQSNSGGPSFEFGEAAVPEKTRISTAVNPLLDVCRSLKDDWNDEEDRSRLAKTVKAADANQVAKIKRWLALAGQDLGVTFRSIVDDHNLITFWAVPRIEHKNRKGNGNGNGHAASKG